MTDRDGNWEIYTADAADGLNPANLTNDAGIDAVPDWSPDALMVVFASNRSCKVYSLMQMDQMNRLRSDLGIPCVMGLTHALERIPGGSEVVLDGTQGVVLVGPSAEEITAEGAFDARRRTLLEDLDRLGHAPAITTDGHRLALRGNLDLPEELDPLADHGAEGVGLLRTEFLVIGRSTLPEEDEQVEYFRRVARRFPGHPVTVRSYDVGGDKFPAAFRIGTEANPFLGRRAIRVGLDRPEVFLPQLRALLRARLDGDVRLMLPMIVEAGEILRTRELLAVAAEELRRDACF